MPYGNTPQIYYSSLYIDPSLFSERDRPSIERTNQIHASTRSSVSAGGNFNSPHDVNYNYNSSGRYMEHCYFGDRNDGLIGTHFNHNY